MPTGHVLTSSQLVKWKNDVVQIRSNMIEHDSLARGGVCHMALCMLAMRYPIRLQIGTASGTTAYV